jgi:hypothetical protein
MKKKKNKKKIEREKNKKTKIEKQPKNNQKTPTKNSPKIKPKYCQNTVFKIGIFIISKNKQFTRPN